MNQYKLFFAALSLGAVTFVHHSAQAIDDKSYLGDTCLIVSGDGIKGTDGSVRNFGTTRLTVTCPIVRDFLNKPIEFVRVVVRDGNGAFVAGADFECLLFARSENGSAIESDIWMSSGASLFSNIDMFLDSAPGTNTFSPDPNAAVNLRCIIPTDSTLFSYRVQEQT